MSRLSSLGLSSGAHLLIYFGGSGKPDGPGHGHYVIYPDGRITYNRQPYEEHGSHNFKRSPELEKKLGSIALDAFQRYKDRTHSGPQMTQFYDGTVKVRVRSGFNFKNDVIVTEIILNDKSHPGEHLHIVYSEVDGSVIHSEWTKNHP
jgi:hypothetical protein